MSFEKAESCSYLHIKTPQNDEDLRVIYWQDPYNCEILPVVYYLEWENLKLPHMKYVPLLNTDKVGGKGGGLYLEYEHITNSRTQVFVEH
jgi:hypothetical protein